MIWKTKYETTSQWLDNGKLKDIKKNHVVALDSTPSQHEAMRVFHIRYPNARIISMVAQSF